MNKKTTRVNICTRVTFFKYEFSLLFETLISQPIH